MKQTGHAYQPKGFWGYGNKAYLGHNLNKQGRYSGGSNKKPHTVNSRGWCTTPPNQFDVKRIIVSRLPYGKEDLQNIGIDKWMSLRDIVSRFPFAKSVKYVLHDGTVKVIFRR